MQCKVCSLHTHFFILGMRFNMEIKSPESNYIWTIELRNGNIVTQFDRAGKEISISSVDLNQVRLLKLTNPILPPITIFLQDENLKLIKFWNKRVEFSSDNINILNSDCTEVLGIDYKDGHVSYLYVYSDGSILLTDKRIS